MCEQAIWQSAFISKRTRDVTIHGSGGKHPVVDVDADVPSETAGSTVRARASLTCVEMRLTESSLT